MSDDADDECFFVKIPIAADDDIWERLNIEDMLSDVDEGVDDLTEPSIALDNKQPKPAKRKHRCSVCGATSPSASPPGTNYLHRSRRQ